MAAYNNKFNIMISVM